MATNEKAILQDEKHKEIDGRWVCGDCGSSYTQKWNLQSHLKQRCFKDGSNSARFPCSQCKNLSFTKEVHLNNHIASYHKWTKTCTRCSIKFIGRDVYNSHLKQVHNITFKRRPPIQKRPQISQICSYCRRCFPNLKEHIKIHHKTSQGHNCSYCSGVFKKAKDLESHVKLFHLEEECLICGSTCSGASEMCEHIEQCHPPAISCQGFNSITVGFSCCCGFLATKHHEVLDHFRVKHVYHWDLVSTCQDRFSCPHCQLSFSSWDLMHSHVVKEHGSYGVWYIEPDYVSVKANGHEELVLLPCPVCHDCFHDQASLDRHVFADHEPFATRMPFNLEKVDFQMKKKARKCPGKKLKTVKDNAKVKKRPSKNRAKIKDERPKKISKTKRKLKIVNGLQDEILPLAKILAKRKRPSKTIIDDSFDDDYEDEIMPIPKKRGCPDTEIEILYVEE